MKLIEKTTKVAELDERDLEVIKHCLNYTVHRIREHHKIIPFLDIKEVERLRREMGIIPKKKVSDELQKAVEALNDEIIGGFSIFESSFKNKTEC